MKGLRIVKWEKGRPWPEVIEWRDRGELAPRHTLSAMVGVGGIFRMRC